ncbi:hypothetical protein L6R52_41645 [Myxococcota bacterium]|nr:hypothetical protein [Myxococcota bacterium]
MTPELRKDPILGRWALVAARSPASLPSAPVIPDVDPCPVCARVAELGGAPVGVVAPEVPLFDRRSPVERARVGGELYTTTTGAGEHELVVEAAAHGTTLAELGPAHVEAVLALWRARLLFLRQDNRIRHHVIVKTEGRFAGARADHACSDVFGLPLVPPSVREKIQGLQGYHRRGGTCAFCDVVRFERTEKTRRVAESMRHVALAPFASRVPFELVVLPKGHHADFAASSDADLADLAALLHEVLVRLDRATDGAAYQLVVMTAPPDMGADLQQFHWHVEISPRLAFDAMLGGVVDVNPVRPEDAARMLREVVL